MNKKTLSEDDISAKYITPAVINAGWDEATQIRRQVYFTKGRSIVRGKLVTRGKAKRAVYPLLPGHPHHRATDIDAFFPDACARVVDAIAEVYKHEAHCKDQQLTAGQRLVYHQAHSATVMTDLKTWMEQQIEDRLVEPNSRLGGAFAYLLNHWEALTRFLHVPGAPLDNNLAYPASLIMPRDLWQALQFRSDLGYVVDLESA